MGVGDDRRVAGAGTSPPRSRRGPRRLVLGVAALTLAACQAGPSPGTTTPAGATTPAGTPTAAATVGPTEGPPTSATPPSPAPAGRFPIEGVDYGFIAPTIAIAGVTTMPFENTGAETHAAQLARLKAGTTASAFLAAFAVAGEAATLAMVDLPGGPNGIGPGTATEAHLDLSPGDYLMYCPVPNSRGEPHYTLGMYSAFTVVAGENDTTAPTPDGEIVLRDMSFELPADTSAGVHTWRVTNEGPSIHEVQLFKLKEGAGLQDLIDAIKGSGGPGGFPAADAGGFAYTSPGAGGSFTIDLSPGTYAALCFVWDPATSRFHFSQGMATTFDVA